MTDTVASLRDQLLQIKALHDSGALATPAYHSARAGLERRLVDLVTADAAATPLPAAAALAAEPRAGKRLWSAAVLVAALVAAGGYAWTGSPGAVDAPRAGSVDASAAAQGVTPQQVAAMVDKLAARLADRPDDAEGWRMLSRSYLVLDKPAEAAAAYERYLKLRPDDAAAWADYADALAARNDHNLEGQPLQLLQRSLALDPGNLKALMLLGTAAFNRGDYAAALPPWDRMAQVGPADDPLVQQAVLAAAEARRRGQLPAAVAGAAVVAGRGAAPSTAAAQASPPAPASTGAAAAVSGTVTLAPALQAQAAPTDTVFIFARAAQGPRMPLAIVRKQVKDLPFDFTLDDSLAMSPAARLSGAGQVIVGARVSRSGQPIAQPGDLEALSAPLPVGSRGVRLTIAKALP